MAEFFCREHGSTHDTELRDPTCDFEDGMGNGVDPSDYAVIDRTNEQQCPVCFMADLDHGSGPETIQIWTMYHDSYCSGRWASTTGSEQQCGRGPCYLGNGHEGECEPGPSIRPAGSEQP